MKMSEEKNIIDQFSQYSSWLSTLEGINEELWSRPIAKGKWSISEIIAHITNWDNHLLSEVIPAVKNGQGMEFPDFDTYNKEASNYVKSGKSQSELLEEAKRTREQLVRELHALPTETLNKATTSNDVTHCPHTGTPYSLLYIIKEFIDHDNHHKKQILQFLKEVI